MHHGFKVQWSKISELEKSINYTFKDQNLLIEAITHPSLKQNSTDKDYERLELLGDSILNFVITEFLFKQFLLANEGKLAKLRAYLVCKDTLHQIAQQNNIAKYILMTYGEEALGGRENQNNLENVLEAIIGAIYLDSDIDTIRSVILNLWDTKLVNPSVEGSDPKTTLQEWSQSKFNIRPQYEVINQVGPPHSPTFTVQVAVHEHKQTGHGSSIKFAAKEAARNLIKSLNILYDEK